MWVVQLLWFVQVLLKTPQCMQVLLVHSLAAAHFSLSTTVTVNAESVDYSTPAVRVTWRTTASPECVASVTVEFRTSSTGPVVTSNTTNNASQTEIIQSGLECATNYHISVVVAGQPGGTRSGPVLQVFVGGKAKVNYKTKDVMCNAYSI